MWEVAMGNVLQIHFIDKGLVSHPTWGKWFGRQHRIWFPDVFTRSVHIDTCTLSINCH